MTNALTRGESSAVRKPTKSTDLTLEVLELLHAVCLHVEAASPDGDISELNNAVRSRLSEMRKLAGLFSEAGERK